MKALLINGSPHKAGVTNLALEYVAKGLAEGGCESEIVWLGAKPISGCLACGQCRKLGRCVVDDVVNTLIPKAQEADGLVVGSPVHYAAPSGQVVSAMHRLFYTGAVDWTGKVGAAVVNCRRGGAASAFDQLNKYFTISGMQHVRGGASRRGGPRHDAAARPQHGMAHAVRGRWRCGGAYASGSRAQCAHQLCALGSFD